MLDVPSATGKETKTTRIVIAGLCALLYWESRPDGPFTRRDTSPRMMRRWMGTFNVVSSRISGTTAVGVCFG